MSKTFHNTTLSITARPRSKRLREAGGYYTAISAGKNRVSNGGQAVIDGGLSDLFEEVLDDNGTVVGIKSLHNLHIIQTPADEDEGTAEVLKDITALLRHLRLEQRNDNLVLVSDITFASERNLLSGWIGSSGGSSGGGSLATLADVTIGTPAAGDILRYDALTSHWVNTPLSLSLGDLSNVQIGTPSTGQALVYDSTAGKWKPGNVGGGGTVDVVSGDATIGTSLTTLGTINGTPIRAKIDNYLLISQFIASNIVGALGTTPVNCAKADESGNIIKNYYAANLVVSGNSLLLKNGSNTTLSTITGGDIKTVLGIGSSDTIATQSWVVQQGYITSSALSGYATQTWVGQQGYLTSSAISDMATKTWVGQQDYVTSSDLSGYMKTTTYTGNGTTPVNRAYADESGNNIKATYGSALDYSSSEGRLYLKTKNQTLVSYVTGAQLVAVIGTNAVARATADASGNTITTSYLRKNVDDTMSANLTIGADGSTKTLMVYGSGTFSTTLNVGTDATIGGNVTIGAQTGTNKAKTLTVYGRNNSTTPAITIYGVVSSSSRYSTSIWRDANALQISSNIFVNGNFKASGYSNAGASASDRRLKKDIRPITIKEAGKILSALKPVTFQWNEEAEKLGDLRGVSRGFIADEFLVSLPNAGRKMWDKYDALYYEQVIPYLVAGWQQQDLRIRILEGEIKNLQYDNDLMRRRLREANVIR